MPYSGTNVNTLDSHSTRRDSWSRSHKVLPVNGIRSISIGLQAKPLGCSLMHCNILITKPAPVAYSWHSSWQMQGYLRTSSASHYSKIICEPSVIANDCLTCFYTSVFNEQLKSTADFTEQSDLAAGQQHNNLPCDHMKALIPLKYKMPITPLVKAYPTPHVRQMTGHPLMPQQDLLAPLMQQRQKQCSCQLDICPPREHAEA